MRKKKLNLRLLTSTVNSRTIEKEVRVEFTKFAEKQMERLPKYIREQALDWIESLKISGLPATRKSFGYHDEPLKGNRIGQRSVRLNKAWRLLYQEFESENRKWIQITVIEVNKHEY
jgi:proteic killer suppression protein